MEEAFICEYCKKKFKVRDRTNHIFFCQNKFIEQRLKKTKEKKNNFK